VLGKSALSFFQDLRRTRVHLLRTSSDDVEKIAAVGYADGITLRNLLRRKFGRGVREIRSERTAG
jgi:transcriptional regulator GlxA family with amidase domain